MGSSKIRSGEFTMGEVMCEYSLNYLNVQEEYQLSGKITVIKNSRKWHFNTQKKTEYNGSGIRTEFNKEMRFMGGLCGLLEKEKLIPRG